MRWLMVLWLAAWAIFSFPWTSVTPSPHWDRVRPPRVRAESRIRADHVLNVVFYFPAAPFASALGWPLSAGIAGSAVMSATAEGVQLFSSDRAPDGNDVIANIAGAIAGAIAVWLY